MKSRIQYVIVFIVIIVIGFAATFLYLFKKSDTSVASKRADLEIEASKLLQDYEKDENEANILYLNKIIIVKGTVESISEDSLGITVYLKEKGAVSGVICSFDSKSTDTTIIKKGNITNVKGICNGYLMDVILSKCSIVADT